MSGLIDSIRNLDWKQIAPIGSAIGAGITIVTSLSSSIAQYSKEEKRKRQIGKATRLIHFIQRVSVAMKATPSTEFTEALPVWLANCYGRADFTGNRLRM